MQTYTVDKLLGEAMSLMGEGAKFRDGYAPYAVDIVNNLLADCFAVNNSIRAGRGLGPLQSIPVLADLADGIPFEYECIKNVMAYGLAFWLLYHDGENDRANLQNIVYETNKGRYTLASYDDVAGGCGRTGSGPAPGGESSGGDMTKAEYDNALGTGVVNAARDARMLGGQEADAYMLRASYDPAGSGVVNAARDAEKLGGLAADRYLARGGAVAVIRAVLSAEVAVARGQTLNPVPLNKVLTNTTGATDASVLSGGKIIVPDGFTHASVAGSVMLSYADTSSVVPYDRSLIGSLFVNNSRLARADALLSLPNVQMQCAMPVTAGALVHLSAALAAAAVADNTIYTPAFATCLTVTLYA